MAEFMKNVNNNSIDRPKIKLCKGISSKTNREYDYLELTFKGFSKRIFFSSEAEKILWQDIENYF